MNRGARIGTLAAVAAALAAAPLASAGVEAQEQGRFRVLVPDFRPLDGADRRFGERVAERVARLIDQYDTHQPVPNREYQQALRSNNLNRQDIDCISARQLAQLMNVQLVMCGTYESTGDGFRVAAEVFAVGQDDFFEIAAAPAPARNGEDVAAQHVNQEFGRIVQQMRTAGLCLTFYESQAWESALSNCTQAIELAPGTTGARLVRAMVYRELGELEKSLADLEEVLRVNPMHQNALQNAGYVAAQLGDREKSLRYYREFLEMDPDNHRVRMQVAYEMANELGDPAGAAALLEEGVRRAPDNVELLERFGAASFATAQSLAGAGTSNDDMPAGAREAYQKALQAFERVFELKGEDTDASLLANSIRTYVALGDANRGVEFARRVVQIKGDNASIRQAYASALHRAGDLAEAVRQLDEAKRIDPNLPNVSVMQGQWLFQAGQFEEGFRYIREAVEKGEQTPEAMAVYVWGQAWNNGLQGNRNLALGVQLIEMAKTLPIQDPMVRSQLDFWHGFGIFNQAIRLAEPENLQSAQRTLPMFRQALELFRAGQAWATSPQSQVRNNYAQYIANTEQYIEIQELLIRRGR